jgi:hypothetical protein
MGEQRPGNPRIPVGKRHGSHVRVSPFEQFVQPTAARRFTLCGTDYRSGSVYQQGSQVRVTAVLRKYSIGAALTVLMR